MKKIILRYGLYSALTISAINFLGWTLGKSLSFSTQEVIGYTSMILSTSFVYFAIKHFRDKENNGHITFKKALVIGLLIVLFASTAFAIADYIYTTIINPDFKEEYLEYALEGMKTSLPPNEFEIKKVEVIEQMEAFTPSFMAIIMFFTVFTIGFIMTLISSLILQRK